MKRPLLFVALSLLGRTALAQVEPYSYYGGEIDADEKNAAVEACEYRVLVEEQRCNTSLNKTECIKDVHAECLREFGPEVIDDPDERDEFL